MPNASRNRNGVPGGLPPAGGDRPRPVVSVGPDVDARFARAHYIATQMISLQRACYLPPDGVCGHCAADITERFHRNLPLQLTWCPQCGSPLTQRAARLIEFRVAEATTEELFNVLRAGDTVTLGEIALVAYGRTNGYLDSSTWPAQQVIDCRRRYRATASGGHLPPGLVERLPLSLESCTAILSKLLGRSPAATEIKPTRSAQPDHEEDRRERDRLAAYDRQAWLATFDGHGRYLCRASGYWESIANEEYVEHTGEWVTVLAAGSAEAQRLAYTQRYDHWISRGNKALTLRDMEAASEAFGRAQYWHERFIELLAAGAGNADKG